MDTKLVFLILAFTCFSHAVETDGDSCADRCNTDLDESRSCQCNAACKKYEDCCEDYGKYCLVEVWNEYGRAELQKALQDQELNKNLARNVIIFIGDGMDLTTITAARVLKGQRKGNTGEEETIVWETFPHVGLSKTYNTDRQVGDSGATATAMFAGVKTKYNTIGVDDTVEYDTCSTTEGAIIQSIMVSAQEAGKSTGVVTTSRITHATPACMYAHSANRGWEYEAKDGCTDIASQILTGAGKTNVLLGGGRRYLMPNTTNDPEYEDTVGLRKDGRNIIEEWMVVHEGENYEYVWNKEGLENVDTEDTEYLMGLFEPGHMQYEQDRDVDEEPSLAEMVTRAIEVMQTNRNGFLLMVEGARIDHAHHNGLGQAALVDTLALDDAVAAALRMVNTDETLVIVTSDHAHGMAMVGYPQRGNPILGLNDNQLGQDGLPFATLQYTGGPGAHEEFESLTETGQRRNLTEEQTSDPHFVQSAFLPLGTAHHAGQDVSIYAIGPMSHLFHSTHEQSYIAHVIRHAACIGDYTDNCSRIPTRKDKSRKQPSLM